MEKPKTLPFWKRVRDAVVSGVIIRAILAGLIWLLAWSTTKLARWFPE